jgi:hypothetical protein
VGCNRLSVGRGGCCKAGYGTCTSQSSRCWAHTVRIWNPCHALVVVLRYMQCWARVCDRLGPLQGYSQPESTLGRHDLGPVMACDGQTELYRQTPFNRPRSQQPQGKMNSSGAQKNAVDALKRGALPDRPLVSSISRPRPLVQAYLGLSSPHCRACRGELLGSRQ